MTITDKDRLDFIEKTNCMISKPDLSMKGKKSKWTVKTRSYRKISTSEKARDAIDKAIKDFKAGIWK